MDSGSSSPYTTFILKVDIQEDWQNTMIKVLKGIPGATFSIDPNGFIRVSGNIGPAKTLKLLAKAGKLAQIYSIDSGTSQPAVERGDHCHHLDDHQGRSWQANHQYYQPPPFPPHQYLPQPPPMQRPELYYPGQPQCTIM